MIDSMNDIALQSLCGCLMEAAKQRELNQPTQTAGKG